MSIFHNIVVKMVRVIFPLFSLALIGCASMAPPYLRPPLPVAAIYPESGLSIAIEAEHRQPPMSWQDYFTPPRLQALIAQALDNNRDLRTAAFRVEEARALYRIQRADQFPSVGVGSSLTRSRVPGDLNMTGSPLLGSQYEVGLSVGDWELDFWGRIRSLKDAALESFLASDAARREVSIRLIAQVANSYLSVCELDERIALARQTIATREESLRIFRRRAEVGAISNLELTQVETLLQQALILSAQLQQVRAVEAHTLVLLVGIHVDLEPPAGYLDDAGALGELHAGLPSDLLMQRPDIMAAEHQLKAANANIGAARAAFFPRIALTGSFGTASSELSGLFGTDSGAWSFAPNLLLPIFNGGRNQGNLDLAEVRTHMAVAHYEKVIQGAFREVSDALSNIYWLTEQGKTVHEMLLVQMERSRLAKLRYDHGAVAFFEVLDAQRDLLVIEQQRVQVRRMLLSSRVELYTALGGGALQMEAFSDIEPLSMKGSIQ